MSLNQPDVPGSDAPWPVLLDVLSTMRGVAVTEASYTVSELHGGTLGQVRLVQGVAIDVPFSVVWKTQRRWERHGDPDSWRREYDLYQGPLGQPSAVGLRWPACYRAELTEEGVELWLQYIKGTTGLDLTPDMYERAAEALGRFQANQASQNASAWSVMSDLTYAETFYERYRSWPRVYDYVRSANELPEAVTSMLIEFDDHAEAIYERIRRLPVVVTHRDFWVANLLVNDDVWAIDWDTTGWGYLGEDLASLLVDEADVEHLEENYRRCIPAYYRGLGAIGEGIADHAIREHILMMFGYRLVEWFLDASGAERDLHRRTLEIIARLT